MTLSDLLMSWDTMTDMSNQKEMIHKYENFSIFAYKFLVSLCNRVYLYFEKISKHTDDFRSEIMMINNLNYLKEIQESTLSTTRPRNSSRSSNASMMQNYNGFSRTEVTEIYLDVMKTSQNLHEFVAEFENSNILKYFIDRDNIVGYLTNENTKHRRLGILYEAGNLNICNRFETILKCLLDYLLSHSQVILELENSLNTYRLTEPQQTKLVQALSAPVSKYNSKSISDIITSAIKLKIQEVNKKRHTLRSGLKEDFEEFVKRFKINEINFKDLTAEELNGGETDSQSIINSVRGGESTSSPMSKKRKKTMFPKVSMPSISDRRNLIRDMKQVEIKIKSMKKLTNKKINKISDSKDSVSSRYSNDVSLPLLSIDNPKYLYRTYTNISLKR